VLPVEITDDGLTQSDTGCFIGRRRVSCIKGLKWHRMLYSCTDVATVGVKGLKGIVARFNKK